MFHIILWSSLGLVVVGWFAVLAMFNMDVGNYYRYGDIIYAAF